MAKIPKQVIPLKKTSINNPISPKEEHIVFSFESLDRNEYFDFSTTCDKWGCVLIENMQRISQMTVKELKSRTGKNISTHSLRNADLCPVNPPDGIKFEEMDEIRFAASKGRIHGRFVENVFYVIWLDPLHNVYPSKRRNSIPHKVHPINTTCCDMFDSEIEDLNNRLSECEKERDELIELLDSVTK